MADQTNPIIAWLSETLQRLFSKSPKYFKIWNIILAALALIPQIPSFLALVHITVPTPWSETINNVISIAAGAAFFMSKLTVKDATAIASDPETNKLPFTAVKDTNTVK